MGQEIRIKGEPDEYVPMKTIELAINNGHLNVGSQLFLDYLETKLGHKLFLKNPLPTSTQTKQKEPKPQSSATATAPKPMGSAIKIPKWLESGVSLKEMYDTVQKEVSELKERDIAGILKKKNYGLSLAANYETWCKPELFHYLSIAGLRGEQELQAACWPARVTFFQKLQTIEGQEWATPYITVYTTINGDDSKDAFNVRKGEMTYNFYLNDRQEVRCIKGKVQETEILNEKNADRRRDCFLEDWKKSDAELIAQYYNIPDEKEQLMSIKTDGTEGWQEKYYFKRPDYRKWGEVYNLSNFTGDKNEKIEQFWNQFSSTQKNELLNSGKEILASIPAIVRTTKGLRHYRYEGITDYDKNGKAKYLKGFSEDYVDEKSDKLEQTWNQEFMAREINYYSSEEFEKRSLGR